MSEYLHRYICIEGNIGAGKTTIAGLLANECNANLVLESFADNPFLPIFYKEPDRYAFPVEVHFLMERHKQLLDKIYNQSLFSPIIVADYCPHKSLIFARQNLSDQEFRLYKSLFDALLHQIKLPDIILYINRSQDWLINSIKKRGRSYESNIEPAYLEKLHQSYQIIFSQETRFPVIWINAFEKDFLTNQNALDNLKSLLRIKYEPGFHSIEL